MTGAIDQRSRNAIDRLETGQSHQRSVNDRVEAVQNAVVEGIDKVETVQHSIAEGLAEQDRVLWTMARDLADLVKVIGKESEDGLGGTGMVGQIKQLIRARERSDRWINLISGGFTVLVASLGVIWWLVKAKLAAFFH